jgi:hypothetical protein
MDTSISYATREPLSAEQRDALLAFVACGTAGYEWWAEPIRLADDPERPGTLSGSTRLAVLLADPAVDSFMASTDFERIVWALESASARFGVGWVLALAGEPAGTIENGRRSSAVEWAIEDLLQVCEMKGVHPEDLDREAILADLRGAGGTLSQVA